MFHTAIAEEPESLLELLIPCPNARNDVGENRDKLVFNGSFCSDTSKLRVFEFLGKLLGVARRNNILVNLNIPSLIWKPLCSDILTSNDLYSVDIHLSKSLDWIQSGEADEELLFEILGSYVDTNVAEQIIQHVRPISLDSLVILRKIILHLNTSQQRQVLSYFYKGLNCVVPTELFSMFTTNELEIVFCGEPDVNINLLQEATIYEGVSPSEP